jgi:DNA-binding transcriptional regulator YiaG
MPCYNARHDFLKSILDMTQEQRTERLREIMRKHRMKARDVGAILGRASQTVRAWACKYKERSIPENELRLLELEVARKAAE